MAETAELSIEWCKSIAKDCKGLFWLDIGGGEPFLHNDLSAIVSLFDAKVVMIPTNGYATDRIVDATAEILNKSNADIGISISLEGFKGINDRLRRPGSFDAAWNTFEKLKSRFNIPVKINTVLSTENENEIIDFMELVRKRKPDFHSVILLRGNTADPRVCLPDLVTLQDLIPKIVSIQATYGYGQKAFMAAGLRLYHRLMWQLSYETLAKKKQAISCAGGAAHAVVYANGSVAPCEILGPVGSLDNASFLDITASAQWKRKRESIGRKECYCTHNCAMLDSIVFNPLGAAARIVTMPSSRGAAA